MKRLTRRLQYLTEETVQPLKNGLSHNKQVKAVTRDRASAYASAIQEILPDALQIADRFHLHQNLLEAHKKYSERCRTSKYQDTNRLTVRSPLYPRKAWKRNIKKTSCIVG